MRARSVEIAVKLTDKTTFALAMDEIKFEIFPPGHAATRIIPKAIVGVRKLLKMITRINVENGRRINCEIVPMTTDFGFSEIFLK